MKWRHSVRGVKVTVKERVSERGTVKARGRERQLKRGTEGASDRERCIVKEWDRGGQRQREMDSEREGQSKTDYEKT